MEKPIGNEGGLEGTTPVEAIGAPAAGKQRVIPVNGILVHNADTVAHDILFTKKKGAVPYWADRKVGLAAGESYALAVLVVLDDTDESLCIESDATGTSDEPTFVAAAMECD